jgi:alpha/beta superfamily hydrolase
VSLLFRRHVPFCIVLILVQGSGLHTKGYYVGRILREVVEPFSRRGFNVILLNSRGVGGSTGRASFTGLPEAEDFKEVVKWFMQNQFPALEELILLVRSSDLCWSDLH